MKCLKHTKSIVHVLLQYLLAHLVCMVLLAQLEKCVHHTTYWCFLHTHAVVLAHQIWCASTVAPSTPNLVFSITHLKYRPTVSRMADSGVLYTPNMVCAVH